MPSRSFWRASDGALHTSARGHAVLRTPALNKGVAFDAEEREALEISGLLPSAVLTIEEQVRRAGAQIDSQPSPLAKNVTLRALQDRNEVLFYRLLAERLEELLPIVYNPTVGEAIRRYSHEYRRPVGVYLSIDDPDGIEEALRNSGLRADELDLIAVTDSEGILGIGDWGVGGMNIVVGKLAVYTAAAGVDPTRVLPVALDVGTDNPELLDDEFYVGLRHERVRGERYDRFVDAFVETAARLFPRAVVHWEDFGLGNARRILERWDERICTFNDDIEGTGAVTLAAVLRGSIVSGTRMADHRVVLLGPGSAGIGIAEQLRAAMVRDGLGEEEAARRFWCVGLGGLLTEGSADLADFQAPFAQPAAAVTDWPRDEGGNIAFDEVVRRARPTVLIGTSTARGAFTEAIVREMAAHVERPIVLPMSNPTSNVEAMPEDVLRWTDGRALVATGIPARPVTIGETTYAIGQANNALVFPGIGMGAIVARARQITDGMLTAAAEAIAELVQDQGEGTALLPPITGLRSTSAEVARRVAEQAIREGVADEVPDDLQAAVDAATWEPVYGPVRPG